MYLMLFSAIMIDISRKAASQVKVKKKQNCSYFLTKVIWYAIFEDSNIYFQNLWEICNKFMYN